jgi:hypothetical protein
LSQTSIAKTQSSSAVQLLSLALGAWTGLVIIYLIEMFVLASPDHDQAWYLCAAQRVLSGARIYGPQIVETNPPLIIWFSTIPVFLGRLLHLDPIPMLKLTVLAAIFVSLLWSGRILRAAGLAQSLLLSFIAIGSVLSAEIFLHAYDLGQREHLLVILLLPYVLSAVFADKLRLSFAELCALGLVAGIAVCFKPQQVLILIALEIFLAAWTRSLRRLANPAVLSAILAILTYILLVRLAIPQYFTTVIPLLRETYWAYGPFTIWQMIKREPLFDAFFVATLLLFVWRRHRLRYAVTTGAFLACSLGGAIAYCIQRVGSPYQAFPQITFLLLAVLWLGIGLLPTSIASGWKPNPVFAVSSAVVVLMFVPLLILAARVPASAGPYQAKILAQYPPQTPIYIFSDYVWDGFPYVLKDHLVWASRFPCLWMLSAIVQNERAETGGPAPAKILPPEVVKRLADLQRAQTVEDFQRWKPVVVIVRRCGPSTPCVFLGRINFDPIPWFLKSPAFSAEWSHYRLQSSHGAFDVYTRVR